VQGLKGVHRGCFAVFEDVLERGEICVMKVVEKREFGKIRMKFKLSKLEIWQC